MNFRSVLLIACFSSFVIFSYGQLSSGNDQSRPNIVLILADDMGYSDIGCFGSEIETPNIDRLAHNGIRFTRMYTNAWCSPSRASLMTGLYPQQVGMGVLADPRRGSPGPYQGYLNKNCVTLAEVFKQAGYTTAISGKWHLGDSSAFWPAKRGFDHAFGLISGASNYFDISKDKSPAVTRKMALNNSLYTPPQQFFMTDAITSNALSVLDDQKNNNKPFFLYLAYTAPHWPLQALEEDIKKYKGKYQQGWDNIRTRRFEKQKRIGIIPENTLLPPKDSNISSWNKLSVKKKYEMQQKMEVYAAQIDRMDQGIGQILAKLTEMGKSDNTIILFLSDNGGCGEGGTWGFDKRNNGLPPGGVDSYMSYGSSWANMSNTPLSYYKKSLSEGGIATSFIISWPLGIAPSQRGSISGQVAHLTDIMPTLCELTGSNYPFTFNNFNIPPMEGQSLAGSIKGTPIKEHLPICLSLEERKAVVWNDYKIISSSDEEPWELYNLAKDRGELKDLAKKDPDRVSKMEEMWRLWAARTSVFNGRPQNKTE